MRIISVATGFIYIRRMLRQRDITLAYFVESRHLRRATGYLSFTHRHFYTRRCRYNAVV